MVRAPPVFAKETAMKLLLPLVSCVGILVACGTGRAPTGSAAATSHAPSGAGQAAPGAPEHYEEYYAQMALTQRAEQRVRIAHATARVGAYTNTIR